MSSAGNTQYSVNGNKIKIYGFDTILANTLIIVTMRVYIPYIALNPYFQFVVSIGSTDDLANNQPIMYNTVTSFPTLYTNNYISAVTGA